MNAFTFTAKLDQKGRVTIPSQIRKQLDLEKSQKVTLQVKNFEVIKKDVNSLREATEIIEATDKVQSFEYENGILKMRLKDQ